MADYVNVMARPNRENLSTENSRIVGVRLMNAEFEQLSGEAISEGVTVSKLIRKRLSTGRLDEALKYQSVPTRDCIAGGQKKSQRRDQ